MISGEKEAEARKRIPKRSGRRARNGRLTIPEAQARLHQGSGTWRSCSTAGLDQCDNVCDGREAKKKKKLRSSLEFRRQDKTFEVEWRCVKVRLFGGGSK